MQNELVIATYNIELSLNVKKIVANISDMAKKGVNVFCLQEIRKYPDRQLIIAEILKELGNNWKAAYHINEQTTSFNIGSCILWNTKILHLEKEEKVLLPKLKKMKFHEITFAKLVGGATYPLQRRTITCRFIFQNKHIQITSHHSDHVGGAYHRIKQIDYLMTNRQPTKHEIICGDFNTFDLLQTGKEKEMLQQTLGSEFIDASENVGHTDDLYHLNMNRAFPLIKWFIKTFHIHIRRRLDYIWVKHFQVIDCRKVEVGGSDHMPIIARLQIK